MSALVIIGCKFTALYMNDLCHLDLRILAADQSRMRSRDAITPIAVSLACIMLPSRSMDIGHIGICSFVTDGIALNDIVNIFGGGIIVVISLRIYFASSLIPCVSSSPVRSMILSNGIFFPSETHWRYMVLELLVRKILMIFCSSCGR